MRKLYREFFYIPKHGKVCEKVMLARIATTIAIVVVCFAAMGISAYAYFSCNVTSGANVIKTANFEAKVTVLDAENVPVAQADTQSSMQAYQLPAGTYTVKLEKGTSSAETGFCIIYVGETKYHTQQIGVDVTAANNIRPYVEFQLDFKESTAVSIQSHWGTSSHYSYNCTSENGHYITNSEPIKTIVVGTDTPKPVIHTVISGENLVGIAEKYGTSVSRIAAYNSIADPGNIQAGQIINIPPADWQLPEKAGTTTREAQ